VKHLRLLSNFENGRRTRGRDWPVGECINGHPNSMLHTNAGGTRCSQCQRDAKRRWVERNPEKRKASVDRYNRKRRQVAA
jgi:hypothetical protein